MSRAEGPDGILLIDKPEGITSAEVVRQVKRTLQVKVGHLGTLDPFASGVLPLCLGEGTKIAQFLNTADKSYAGLIRLGVRTDSGDRTGVEVERRPVPPLDEGRCAQVAGDFLGERLQTPPMHSAVKRDGVPLYKLARRGVEVERVPRRIRIDRLEMAPSGTEALRFSCDCSKGTYVRVLAEEIGAALGTAAHLEQLRRTRFGHFRVGDALLLPLDREATAPAVISPREALPEIPELCVDAADAARVRRGQTSALARLPAPPHPEAVAKLVGDDGALLAVVVSGADCRWSYARVMAA